MTIELRRKMVLRLLFSTTTRDCNPWLDTLGQIRDRLPVLQNVAIQGDDAVADLGFLMDRLLTREVVMAWRQHPGRKSI